MTQGRPKIQLSDLPDNWQARVIALYQVGGSDVEVRASCFNSEKDKYYVMSDDLFYRLIEEEEVFSRTIKSGRSLSELWWQSNGRVNLKDKDFNATLWYMNMKNRFKWSDKQEIQQEISNKGGEAFKIEDINKMSKEDVKKTLLELTSTL